MPSVLLVGCGNMGFAMLKGWLESDPGLDVHVVDPSAPLMARALSLGAKAVATAKDLPVDLAPDLIVLAVKPQRMADVAPAYARFAGGPACVVSVAAGTTIATLATLLPGPTPIVRAMPNTPASIGQGMVVCCANAHTTQTMRTLATTLMAASGLVDWIEDEALMDAVTALSGSGPAYVFHMIECLAAAGQAVGLPPPLAARMAQQTVMGAGQLAVQSNTPPGLLREQVTSPGGTTAAGLAVLMGEDRLQELMTATVVAARDRGRALANG